MPGSYSVWPIFLEYGITVADYLVFQDYAIQMIPARKRNKTRNGQQDEFSDYLEFQVLEI